MEYKIIDNFLNDSDFTELLNCILPIPTDLSMKVIPEFGWDYICSQVNGDEEQNRFKTVTNIDSSPKANEIDYTKIDTVH